MQLRFVQASDASLLVIVGDQLSAAASDDVARLFRALSEPWPAWLTNLHPGYASVLVDFELARVSHDEVAAVVRERTAAAGGAAPLTTKTVDVCVRYGGADGPDLDDVARHAGLSTAEVIGLHGAPTYTVAFLGFMPGFAYLLGLPPALATPRLAVPRTRVPAGSVAIGGEQTALYPQDSPGGWRLIGRAEPPAADWVEPGDRVRFVPA